MNVKKRDDKLEKFDKNKIIKSCKRAGTSEKIADDIATIVSNDVYDGISTTEIRMHVIKELERKDSKAAMNFRNFKKKSSRT